MSIKLSSMTKAQLIAVINTKDVELAALRDRVSVLSAQKPELRARPQWQLDRRAAMDAAKAEAIATGRTVLVRA